MDYSVVVPVYRSGEWIADLAERIHATVSRYGTDEIILVNDCSPDETTWPAIERCAASRSFVRGIDLVYNVGQFRATLCGIANSSGKWIITIDDDFQHPPEEISKLIEGSRAHPGIDCIFGKYAAKRHSLIRNAGSRLIQKIMSALYGKSGSITTTSFRIMPRTFAMALVEYRSSSPQLGPLISGMSKRLMNVTVEHSPRLRGKSGYSLGRCISETFKSIVNASTRPIRMFTMIGFASALVAFAMTAYYLARWIMVGTSVAGYTSLILAVTFFSGLILMGVGILGEYIGRIISEVSGAKRFMIRKIAGGD